MPLSQIGKPIDAPQVFEVRLRLPIRRARQVRAHQQSHTMSCAASTVVDWRGRVPSLALRTRNDTRGHIPSYSPNNGAQRALR
jgi:hypothetical protein